MRVLPVLGAFLLLCACSTDVFVTPDSGTDGGDGGDGGIGTGDGSTIIPIVKCNAFTCTGHTCCAAGGWDLTSCAAASTEGQPTCSRYLECDDSTDCPQPQVCCAAQVFDSTLNKDVITSAKCATTCSNNTTSVQLCNTDQECLQGNCQNNSGNPSWVKTCQ
jgi:hypothetical protein